MTARICVGGRALAQHVIEARKIEERTQFRIGAHEVDSTTETSCDHGEPAQLVDRSQIDDGHDGAASAAACTAAMSIFVIVIIARKARAARDGSGSDIIAPNSSGHTCHDRP